MEIVAQHEVSVDVPIDATAKVSVVLRDMLPAIVQQMEMMTPYIQLSGIIENSRYKDVFMFPLG